MSPMRDGAQQGDLQPAEAAQDLVYGLLKKRVLTLPAQEGAFLTEAEVCRAMGTSRTPVREALLRLESEGLLKILPKKRRLRARDHGGRSRGDHAGQRLGRGMVRAARGLVQ